MTHNFNSLTNTLISHLTEDTPDRGHLSQFLEPIKAALLVSVVKRHNKESSDVTWAATFLTQPDSCTGRWRRQVPLVQGPGSHNTCLRPAPHGHPPYTCSTHLLQTHVFHQCSAPDFWSIHLLLIHQLNIITDLNIHNKLCLLHQLATTTSQHSTI